MALRAVPIATPEGAREIRQGADGSIRVPSSYGQAGTTWGLDPEFTGSEFDALGLYSGDRAQELDYRSSYFRCRQHDRRPYDMDARLMGPHERGGYAGMTPMLNSAPSETYVPLSARRPSAPYRLGRLIVRSFTAMLFGMNRWPQIRSTDPDTQAFGEAVAKAASMRNRMIRARDVAGSNGSAGLSWFFRKGKPRMRVHSARFVHVLEWEDVDAFEPAHVTELYQTRATRTNGKGEREVYYVWQRRDWTPTSDVVFHPIEVTPENPPEWVVDEERSYEHGDGFPHFVWLTNFPDDEDPSATDGQPDYDGAYEQLVVIDEMNSVLARGVVRNLDPTLLLKINPALLANRNPLVQKGSDNALVVGETGDADYMTLPADLVAAGKSAVEMNRGQVLEVSQCVVLDPKDLAAAGLSSVAIRTYYAPMINAADVLREPNGEAIKRLLTQMQTSARRAMGTKNSAPEYVDVDVDVEVPANEAEVDPSEDAEPGEPQLFENEDLEAHDREPEQREVEYYLDLPPRVVTEPELDEQGRKTGKETQKLIPIVPGDGEFELEWGEYFPPTVQDKQALATAASLAAGGKAVMSQRGAVEMTASTFNKDAAEEWDRIAAERAGSMDGAYPALGGGDAPDADVDVANEEPDELITPSDMAAITTVNEARGNAGLGLLLLADGQPDPDGHLTVAAYRAKTEAKGAAEGEAEGEPPAPPEPVEPDPLEEPEVPATDEPDEPSPFGA